MSRKPSQVEGRGTASSLIPQRDYNAIQARIVAVSRNARAAAARSVNALMTAAYWEIGRRIVEFDHGGRGHARYGEALMSGSGRT